MAEQLGYHSVFTTHAAGRDSLTVLAAYATVSESVQLGTGVLPIYSRTPVATAQQAVTIDEISASRLTLGIGVSHRLTVENWYGGGIGKPGSEMRDYVAGLRAIPAGEGAPGSRASQSATCATTSPCSARSWQARIRLSPRSSRRASASWECSRGRTCRSTPPACRRRCSSSPARLPTG